MPSLAENLQMWEQAYQWPHQGDEWSALWGGPKSQWYGTIFPRIHAFLPAPVILEIGPGFGRWTRFLHDHCERLIVVDFSERCLAECAARFKAWTTIDYVLNDGLSLDGIDAGSVDFAFSFDSLVHVDLDVIQAYLRQLASRLRPDGVAFLHHSNLAAFADSVTGAVRADLSNPHWRSPSVSARLIERYCDEVGLQCIAQEIVPWHHDILTDAFSLVTSVGSKWARPNRVVENSDFMAEAARLAHLAPLYADFATT